MIRAAAGATMLAVIFAAPAAGEESAAFCTSLGQIVEAANSATPFGALSPNLAAGQSMGKADKLPGFEDASSCSGYMAGTLEKGTVGGGPYNYVECRYFRDSRNSDPKARDKGSEALKALTGKLSTCAASNGWTESTPWPFKPNVRLTGKRYVVPGGEVDVVAYLETTSVGRRADSSNTYFEVRLRVRTQNPNHPYERVD